MTLAATGNAPMMSQECYDQYRAVLVDLHKANTDQHDKAILQLTAGALALTVTFMSHIAPHPLPNTLSWLAGGWTLLVVSMTTMVSSFLTGQAACRRQIALHDQEFREGVRPLQINRWSVLTDWLNSSSFFFFVAGVVSILVFSWLNLSAMPTAKQPGTEPAAKQSVDPLVAPIAAPAKSKSEEPANEPTVLEPKANQEGTTNVTDNTQRPAPLPPPPPPPPSQPKPGHGHPPPTPPAIPTRPAAPPDKK